MPNIERVGFPNVRLSVRLKLKFGLLALTLTVLALGIPYYLDSRIPRATAVVQIHPGAHIPDIDPEKRRGTTIAGPNGVLLPVR